MVWNFGKVGFVVGNEMFFMEREDSETLVIIAPVSASNA